MTEFWLCFVPLFVAVDAIGTLPMFMHLMHGLKKNVIRQVIIQSTVTAGIVGVVFLAIGKFALSLLGITMADFMIAGGSLLFIISLIDMISAEKKARVVDPESVGAVPIGVPLIVGPAVLTTSMLLVDHFGFILTASALIINVLFAGVVYAFSDLINKLIGKAGAKTISKLASIILAAIGVMIIRRGIEIFLTKGF